MNNGFVEAMRKADVPDSEKHQMLAALEPSKSWAWVLYQASPLHPGADERYLRAAVSGVVPHEAAVAAYLLGGVRAVRQFVGSCGLDWATGWPARDMARHA